MNIDSMLFITVVSRMLSGHNHSYFPIPIAIGRAVYRFRVAFPACRQAGLVLFQSRMLSGKKEQQVKESLTIQVLFDHNCLL